MKMRMASDRRIAEMVGCEVKAVREMRRDMIERGDIPGCEEAIAGFFAAGSRGNRRGGATWSSWMDSG